MKTWVAVLDREEKNGTLRTNQNHTNRVPPQKSQNVGLRGHRVNSELQSTVAHPEDRVANGVHELHDRQRTDLQRKASRAKQPTGS